MAFVNETILPFDLLKLSFLAQKAKPSSSLCGLSK